MSDETQKFRQIDPTTGICFFKIQEAQSLVAFLETRADYTPLPLLDSSAFKVADWLHFGSIYLNGLRQRSDTLIQPGDLIRLHTRPKRYAVPFPAIGSFIALEDEEFLVLDKPAGMPTHPTLDNAVENAKALLEKEMGQPIYTTHRLDVATQGLLIFAKTPEAQRLINKRFSKGQVRKIYRARNESSVAPGLFTHFIDPESRLPKTVSATPTTGWWECRLEILRMKAQTGEEVATFGHEIHLLTGKTHQIRAQMAALGAPVCGDVLYGAQKRYVHERIDLECHELSFAFRSRTMTITRRESSVLLD